jgi:hypothetical protein
MHMATDSNVGDAVEATSSEIPSGDEGARTPTTPTGSDENVQPRRELDLTSTSSQDLVSHLLDFLSNASNEKLGACLVGLGATTYFVFGRIGLVLIGIVVGVALHATWEGNNGGSGDGTAKAREARRRREVALDIVGRVLDWRDKKRDDSDSATHEVELKAGAIKPLDFSGFAPETAAALNGLTDAVIRDYVKYTTSKDMSPLTRYLNSLTGGGIPRYSHRNYRFQTFAVRRLRHSSSQSPHIYLASVLPTLSSNLSQIRPP